MSNKARFRAWELIGEAAKLGVAGEENRASQLLSLAAVWMGIARDSGSVELGAWAAAVWAGCCHECGFRGPGHFQSCPTNYETPEARVLR